MLCLPRAWIYFAVTSLIFNDQICRAFWFFSCHHGNGRGVPGDECSVFCHCHWPNTCEAGIQRCAAPGKYDMRCHATRPCASGLSCHPGLQRCFHIPRRLFEPCVVGHECSSGLTCEPGKQVCYHHPRQYSEPCAAGFNCGPGLSCQPGTQTCLHHPRRENEHCSAGFACADGLGCTLCGGKTYVTCQLVQVPFLEHEDYYRPFNKIAFLVTHNSFSNGPKFAVWARNQKFSVIKQLQDGVRGLMLDIYPGWGNTNVRLCHSSCFWSGTDSLLDTLVEIRKFLEKSPREVVTIIFEDYLRNPTILKNVFDQAGLSNHVLPHEHWGSGLRDWPSLLDLRRLGRLVVFNNNGLEGFPYSPMNMWYYVRENRYGDPSRNTMECIDRAQSRMNADFNDQWSLVLVNWIGTVGNPLNPCLNAFKDLMAKLITCHTQFGRWTNFLAVDYYSAGSEGGAFQAVKWLNQKWKEDFKTEEKPKIEDFIDALIEAFHR